VLDLFAVFVCGGGRAAAAAAGVCVIVLFCFVFRCCVGVFYLCGCPIGSVLLTQPVHKQPLN
jgi:hypothetical protein